MNILVVFPHGNALKVTSGVTTRVWSLIKTLIDNGVNVTILHSFNSKGSEDFSLRSKCRVFYYREVKILGISDWYITDLNPFFLLKLFKIIRSQKFNIIQIEYPWGFLSLKLFANKKNLLIYDSQGVEGEFYKVVTKHPRFPRILTPIVKWYFKFYEKLVCKLTNFIICVSDVDRNYYIKNYNIRKNKTFLIQTPSSISHEKLNKTNKSKILSKKKLGIPLDKTVVIFHGTLPHPPNQEAIDLIIKYISPNIKNSDILFVLAGLNLSKFRKGNVISLGFVEDLRDLLISADIAIVPIISGSGMRVKCSDYIIAALPFISTKKGIEGLDFLEEDEDFLLCDTVDENFLFGINLLHENKRLREKFNANLKKKLKNIDFKEFEKKFVNLYSQLNNWSI